MLISEASKYVQIAFDNEAEIERVVLDNAPLFFGPHAIILKQTHMLTGGGRGTVPDGIAIDLQEEGWYLIEAERAAHGTWEHIAPQVARQLTAARHEGTREKILVAALGVVRESPRWAESLEELGISELDLHARIAAILKKTPQVAIPIDSIPKDLEEWVNSVNTTVKIWIIEKYIETKTQEILYSIPDDAVPEIDSSRTSTEPASRSSSRFFREVLDAGAIQVGEELHMIYGPMGQEKQQYTATVREDGLEIGGRVYSPSYAAVECMQKAGSDRTTANGWTMWRNAEGKLLTELYESLGLDSDAIPDE